MTIDLLPHSQICVLVAVATLEKYYMSSADMQWLFYSGERNLAHESLVFNHSGCNYVVPLYCFIHEVEDPCAYRTYVYNFELHHN